MIKISIVTVCFNSAETIRDTIESVLMQTYSDIEFIIIDGFSNDGTIAIIDEYRDKIAVVVSEPDKGIYDAMNKGIRLATGDLVGILNSDDVFSSETTIADLAEYYHAHPDLDGTYADLVYVQRDRLEKTTRFYSSKRFAPWNVRFGLIFPHPTLYVRPQIYDKFGYYKLNYRVAADFELMARFIASGVKLARNPDVMVKMREGGISSNGFWWRVHQNFEIVRACKENGIYTNIMMVMFKIPFKLLTYVMK